MDRRGKKERKVGEDADRGQIDDNESDTHSNQMRF